MGAENVMIAGEGVRYPWSDFEEEQRRNFPNGAPDPLYDKEGVSTDSPMTMMTRQEFLWRILGIILNHRFMTLLLPPRYTWCIVNLTIPNNRSCSFLSLVVRSL